MAKQHVANVQTVGSVPTARSILIERKHMTYSDRLPAKEKDIMSCCPKHLEYMFMYFRNLKATGMSEQTAATLMLAYSIHEFKELQQAYYSSERSRTDHPLFGSTLDTVYSGLELVAEAIRERK